MNTFILIVGLVFLVAAVAILVTAFATPRGGTQEVFEQIGAYGFRGFVSSSDTGDSGTRKSLSELPTTIGTWLSQRLGTKGEEETRRRLVAAGWYTTTPTAYLGYRLLGAIGLTFGFLLLGGLGGLSTVWYV